MIIISSRKDFDNPNEMSDELLIKKDHNDEDEEPCEIKEVNLSEILCSQNSSQKVKILVLAHGYNNAQSEIYETYELIESQLKDTYDHIIGYVWPGGSSFVDWWNAKEMADKAASQFNNLVNKINQTECNISVDLMSHSLGARMCMQALKQSKVVVGKYFCLAASVDSRCFNKEISLPDIADFLAESRAFERELKLEELKKQEFLTSVHSYENVFVFHSKRDRVLQNLYAWIEGHEALGLKGPKRSNLNQPELHEKVCNVDCRKVVDNHFEYKNVHEIYDYVRSVQSGKLEREKTLERKTKRK